MKPIKIAALGMALLLIYGCSQSSTHKGEDEITSIRGASNCALKEDQADESKCSQESVVDADTETHIPPAEQNFSTQSLPPPLAVYSSTTNTGVTALFIGNGFSEQFAARIHAPTNTGDLNEHQYTTFVGPTDQWAPQALWDDARHRAVVLGMLNGGDVELVGLTYNPIYPDVAVYKHWIDHALSKNPDTRFFVATPAPTDPTGGDSPDYAARYEILHAQVHTLIDALSAAYPGVDFSCIPSGQGAVDLHELYSAGQFSDVSTMVGDPASAVFRDSSGHPGDMLVALDGLVWLGGLHDVDLSSYSFDPGYAADLKALAKAILDRHAAKYITPAAAHVDAQGDVMRELLAPTPPRKSNILLIMADDLGYNDLAINNDNPDIDTPNMDQIAREGVRFTRHYASAVCSPARAALLAGFVPERLGYLPNGRGISPDLVTLPERLQAEGYTTWHIGKWHIGDLDRKAWPDHQGFDHWFGFLNQWRLAGERTAGGEIALSYPRYNDPWLESDSAPGQHYTGHLESILTDKAIQVLSDLNAAQAPWFLNLWYYAPHGPVTPATEFAQKYPDTPAGKYRALVNQLDYNIGRVVSHLDTIGALQDTIIVVVSDNGGTGAFVNSNAPFYGNKTTLTEGGLRTPLLIKWPDDSVNGQVISDSVSIEDIYPTLLESIGVTPADNLDGKSFYRGVQRLEPIAPRARYWDHVRSPAWTSYGFLSADGRWRFHQTVPIFGVQVPVLYDFDRDPTATHPVAPAPPLQLAKIKEGYQSWYKDVHTVKTAYAPGANGSGVLTGMDFLRTPGFGTYTFGIGIPDARQGPIAAQAGVWDMSRTSNTVTAQFGALTLSGNIQSSDSCHSVIVSGNFSRQVQSGLGPDRMTLSLYIDGVVAQSVDVEGTLQVDDPSVATIIGDPHNASGVGPWVPPAILNTNLQATSPWTLASFSQSLCSNY